MMMWHGGSGGWIGCWVMALLVIALWALLITGLVALVRSVLSSSPGVNAARSLGPDSAEDVLIQRYARGEIDDAEYERSLAFVRQNTPRR